MKYILKDIKLFGYHGVYDKEKENGQYFNISVTYNININNNIIESDKVEGVLDYIDVCKVVIKAFNAKRCNLLETLAYNIHNSLLNEFNIDNLIVKIKKLKPLSNANIKQIEVEYK